MKSNTYIINSPSFPEHTDFEKFNIWCEWNDSEEINYLKNICSSEEEYEKIIIKPYEEGKETYYPIVASNVLPERNHLHLYVEANLNKTHILKGYISIVDNLIASLTIWLQGVPDNEVILYSADRLVAEDENPDTLKILKNHFNLTEPPKLEYSSETKFQNGNRIKGIFKC